MITKTKLICILLITLGHIALAGEQGFDPQPYTPVVNTPEQLAAKRTALDAFRVQVENNHWDWHQLGYNETTLAGVLKGYKITDPLAVVGHFNPDNGAWHKSLTMPDDIDFSNRKIYNPLYKPHEEYLIEVLALAYLSKYKGENYKDLVFKTLSTYFNKGYAPRHMYNLTFTY